MKKYAILLLMVIGCATVSVANSIKPNDVAAEKPTVKRDVPTQKQVTDKDVEGSEFCCRCAISYAWCADGTPVGGSGCDCGSSCDVAYVMASNRANIDAQNKAEARCAEL